MKFGYKAFNKDLTCRDKQYYLDKINKHDGRLIPCYSGIHYCNNLGNVFKYYQYNPNNIVVYSIIDYSDNTITDGDRSVTDCIELIEEIDLNKEEVKLATVKENGYVIQYIKNPNEETQLTAVKQNEYAIRYIKNPSEKIQLTAVKQNGYAIEFIKNPSEKVQLTAVKQNGYAIHYINNPSEKIQLTAVKQNGYAIKFIKNPTEKVKNFLGYVSKNKGEN